jgi:hypothetical protein
LDLLRAQVVAEEVAKFETKVGVGGINGVENVDVHAMPSPAYPAAHHAVDAPFALVRHSVCIVQSAWLVYADSYQQSDLLK